MCHPWEACICVYSCMFFGCVTHYRHTYDAKAGVESCVFCFHTIYIYIKTHVWVCKYKMV